MCYSQHHPIIHPDHVYSYMIQVPELSHGSVKCMFTYEVCPRAVKWHCEYMCSHVSHVLVLFQVCGGIKGHQSMRVRKQRQEVG